MQSSAKKMDGKNIDKRKGVFFFSWFKRNFYLLLLILISLFTIASIVIILLSKTLWFRQKVSSIVLSTVNSELAEGTRLYFDDIGLSYLLGFKLYNVSLSFKGDTIVSCNELDAGLKILPLLNNHIIVNQLRFTKPKINIIKNKDGKLNIGQIVEPSQDTSQTTTDLLINLNDIELENASLIYYDSTAKIFKGFDYNHLDIKDLNLAVNGQLDLKNSEYKLDFSKLNFYDKNSKLNIKDLNFYAYLDSTKAVIEDLNFESDKSKLGLDITVSNINFFNPEFDIYQAYFNLDLDADNIASSDLAKIRFIPIKFNKDLQAKMTTKGTINNLQINLKNLKYNKTEIAFKAHLVDIEDSLKYRILLDFRRSIIFQKDVYPIITKFAKVELPSFDKLQIEKLNISLNKDSVNTDLNLMSQSGNVVGNMTFDFNHFSYNGNLKSEGFDLGAIINNISLNSNLNSEISFKGSGNKLDNLKFDIKAILNNSRLSRFDFNKLVFKAKCDSNGIIKIDSLFINANNNKKQFKEQNNLFLSGVIDFHNPNNPKYHFQSHFQGIDFAHLLDNKHMPDLVNGNLQLSGSGFEPDSIVSNIKLNLAKMRISSNTIYPKLIKCNITRRKGENKEIDIKSTFLNANISGNFNYLNLIRDLSLQTNSIRDFVENKINLIIKNDSTKGTINFIKLKNPKFTKSNLNIDLQFKDNNITKAFLNNDLFKADFKLKGSLDISDNKSKFSIDSLYVNKFRMKSSKYEIVINPIFLNANVQNIISDSIIAVSTFGFKTNSQYSMFIGDNSINRPNLSANFNNNKLDLNFDFRVNNDISFKSKGSLNLDKSNLNLEFSDTKISYKKLLHFNSIRPIKASFENNTLAIKNFHIKSNIIDDIELSGKINSKKMDNINIVLKKFDLKWIKTLTKSSNNSLNSLHGMLDNVNISLNGAFDNVDENIKMSLSGLTINKTLIGNVSANINHKSNNVSGNMNIIYNRGKNRKLFSLNLKTLPLNLSFDAPKNRYDNNKPVSLDLQTNNLPLELLAPFTNQVSKLRGVADLKIKIKGKNTKSIDYDGNLKIRNAKFLLSANNMNYIANGNIDFVTDTIKIDKIIVENDKRDISKGKINIIGSTILENLNLKYYDIKINGSKFQVLSKASMKSIPNLYGDLVLSFGPSPINIYGNLKAPNIRGDINILRSNLIMPSSEAEEVKKSRLIYKIKQNEINYRFIKDSSVNDTINKADEHTKHQSGLALSNNIDVDMRIFFKGRFVTTMDITGIGQLYAEIGTDNPDMALRFVLNRNDDQPKIFGTDLIVKEGSTLKFIKILNTKGKISFQKGGLKNPGIDFTAVYNGQRYSADEVSTYKVYVYIKGSKEKPLVSFGYSINGKEEVGDSSKINENAILLLALGKTKDEMLNNSGSGNFDIMAPASSFASAAMSTALTDFVQSTGFIQSADIDIGNSLTDLNQAKMKFSGEVKGIRWTLGGTVADFANNNEISIDIPINIDLGLDFINNKILQLTKSTNSTQSASSRTQKDYEIKLKIGGSW